MYVYKENEMTNATNNLIAPTPAAKYNPHSAEYQATLRHDIETMKRYGASAATVANVYMRARRVARIAGITVDELVASV